ncbi:SDR family oxidoreductase [Parapedobacter koreensis]|uniref:NAD(P)H dehydrogenase (Quinone) n=1 Tax=Parapedobacter koreensis TaxID=332977 RepID=A0A1H7S048_9SPHI|nr:SDR family oxidoreductase [Parapedobacter koreensis]SEL65862.1 NAD(P)H dehydrogenase (quinone) [Parapedobacter koreensis]
MAKIGITGATGQLGRLVVEQLKARTATDLVALVRSPEKAADLGIEARAFDYNEPASLVDALQGVEHLLLISSNEIGQRKTQHEHVIQAAQQTGVTWIVYTSVLRADTSTLSLAAEHLATEEALKTSGIPYTILRNGWYTENYAGSIAGAIANGSFIGSAGVGKIASATRADYAEAAAVVLTSEDHQGNVYELAGDEAYTLADLAAEVSRQTGKDIHYNNLPEGEYVEALKSLGLPGGLAHAIAGWDVSTANGDLFDDSHTLSRLINRPTTPLAAYVRKTISVSA